LLETCEADLMKLEKHSLMAKGFFEPPAPPLLVVISTGSFAGNDGYDPHRQSTITIDAFQNAPDPELADETVRMLFVAEAAEVLMGVLNVLGQRWHPFQSDGEGLSRVLSAEFYPHAYYGSIINGPFANAWLNAPSRTNPAQAGKWITGNDSTDKNQESYGSAILFINYLHYQLGHPWDLICTQALSTLALTYKALTGKTDEPDNFTKLMNAHFAPGSTIPIKTDNPFPLWDAQYRSVGVDAFQHRVGLPHSAGEGSAEASPFLGCPPGKYDYTIWNDTIDLSCIARTWGFGQPSFDWNVNGEPVIGTIGDLVAPAALVGVDDPKKPGEQTYHTEDVRLNYRTSDASTYQGMAGQLDLTSTSSPGHIHVTVDVSVREANDPSAATAARTVTLDTKRVVYDETFYRDRKACQKSLRDKMTRYTKQQKLLTLLLTLPDPPHDLVQASHQLAELEEELSVIGLDHPEIAARLSSALTQMGLRTGG
jgi:hypothetical protein